MSSRNRYLSPTDRQTAAQIYQALVKARHLAQHSNLLPHQISEQMQQHLAGTHRN